MLAEDVNVNLPPDVIFISLPELIDIGFADEILILAPEVILQLPVLL